MDGAGIPFDGKLPDEEIPVESRPPDDEEPDTRDRIMLQALAHTTEAMDYLIAVLRNDERMTADRLKAAQHILEVAGCLSL